MSFFDFISAEPGNLKPFELFSVEHAIAIISIFVLMILIIVLFKYTNLADNKEQFTYFLIALIIVEEVLFKLWRIYIFGSPIIHNLSLNLCSMAIICSVFLLINKNQTLYEIVYYWGIAGAFQAILTPDLSGFWFPHFRFFQFFLAHGILIIVPIYLTLIEGFRPRQCSVLKVFFLTNVYALFVYIINKLLNTNYLYILHKPISGSLLDYFGPWPVYIIGLEISAILLFSLVYSPFYISDFIKKIKDKSE